MSTFELTPLLNDPPHPYFTGLLAGGQGIGAELVQIGDRFYLLDLASGRFRMVSIPTTKMQTDFSDSPGEQTLSTEGLWRRIGSSWHLGAGQTWYDREDAEPRRFRQSRGVDVFDQWQATLLPDVEVVDTNATGWSSIVVGFFNGGHRLVAAGGNGKVITVSISGAVTTVAGVSGAAHVASAGHTVYVADANGIFPINAAGTGLGTAFNTNVKGAKLWFAKDRLIAAVGTSLYNVADATTTTAHFIHPWPEWVWTSVHEGGENIYAAGFSGDRGQVYSIAIETDGTGLAAPRVALPLPNGEVPHSVYGYVGFVAVGTNLGLRLCSPSESALVAGALVGFDGHYDHTHPVRAISGQDRFLRFGQDSIFPDAGGMGRVDLSQFVTTLSPAYATDLLGTKAGDVSAVGTLDGRWYFTVSDTLYVESDTVVPSGFIDTGRITMNVADNKIAVYADVRHDPLAVGESIEVWESTSFQDFTERGISSVVGSERPAEVFSTNHSRTVWHELRVILNRGGVGDGPTLTAILLAAQVVPDRTWNLYLPLLIHESMTYADFEFSYDLSDEIDFLTGLVRSQQLFRFRLGKMSFLALAEDFEWVPHHASSDGKEMQGTMVLKIKTLEATR